MTGLRIGIDMGSDSIGWAVLKEDREVVDLGVRTFSNGREPQKDEPLAVARRIARGMRRRRSRLQQRKIDTLQLLTEYGLMPMNKDEARALASKNPYELRSHAVNQAIPPFDLGRALFHICQRRGAKYDRFSGAETQGDEKKKEKSQASAERRLKDSLAQGHYKSLGEYLWKDRLQQGKTPRAKIEEGGEEAIYPKREMYEDEFKKIREVQTPHQTITAEQWDNICNAIFHQRPLKPPIIGCCQLYFEKETVNQITGEVIREQKRAPKALPSFQLFRIAQDIGNLKIRTHRNDAIKSRESEEALTPEQARIVWAHLITHKSGGFDSLANKLKLKENQSFNLESEKKKKLEGDAIGCTLRVHVLNWDSLSLLKRDEIMLTLLDTKNADPEALKQKLTTSDFGLSVNEAEALSQLDIKKLPKGYGRFSQRALHDLLSVMMPPEAGEVRQHLWPLRYDEACKVIGVHHSDRRIENLLPLLPHYGEILRESVVEPYNAKTTAAEKEKVGRISNPTVHIGLRQLEKIVNEIIERYGKPDAISIEMARDLKLSQEEKRELEKEQSANQKNNERIAEDLKNANQYHGAIGDKITKYKLWEELAKDVNDRKCPYTGQQISVDMLFNGAVEIEHILPKSRTWDDSKNNKTLAMTSVNRDKGNGSPYEAFAHRKPSGCIDSDYSYDAILKRVENLPKAKQWRFAANAMERFKDDNKWFERQLNDTRYVTKIAKKYLGVICEDITAPQGRITATLRHKWGLNKILGEDGEKNRNDHRQHAIDAVVIALASRKLIQKINTKSGRGENSYNDFIAPPFENLFEQVKRKVETMVVSHRQDHGIAGRLHEETNYGILYYKEGEEVIIDRRTEAEKKEEKILNLVTRKKLISLDSKKLGGIRDITIRNRVIQAVTNSDGAFLEGAAYEKAIREFSQKTGIRRVRYLSQNNPVKLIKHQQGNKTHIRALVPGENHHVSWWRMPNGKIEARGVSYFDLNTAVAKKNLDSLKPHPAAKLILKIHKGDLLKVFPFNEAKKKTDVQEKIVVVESISPENETVSVTDHFAAGKSTDKKKFKFSFSLLKEYKVRKIHVTPAGKVYDPGPVIK